MRLLPLRSIGFFSLALAVACTGCDSGGSNGVVTKAKSTVLEPRPNVLLVSIDTLRADHLSCYGYDRDTSPHIDRLADESVRFANVFAPAPWTLPSHATMLTGLHSFNLGVVSEKSTIPKNVPMVTELLHQAGYQTAAFVDSMPRGFVGAERGFDRGFETFQHAPHRPGLPFRYEIDATMQAAEQWLEARDQTRPFFLFLHTKAVHSVPAAKSGDPRNPPYFSPEPNHSRYLTETQARLQWGGKKEPNAVQYLRDHNVAFASAKMDPRSYPEERTEALKAIYDGAIHYMDEQIGRLLRKLDQMSLSDQTVVIITADHGEAFLEHNFFLHVELYKQLLHVPLIIRLPKDRTPRVVETPVGLEDIVPTILNFTGIDIPEQVMGRQLPMDPAIKQPERWFYGHYQFGGSQSFYYAYSLQKGDWRLVYHRIGDREWDAELYNVSTDVEEKNPITDKTQVESSLREKLHRWMAAKSPEDSPTIKLDAETIRVLKSLGYLR